MRVAALDIGRVCIKTAGREAGRYCVVLKNIDSSFVFITGPKVLTGVKRRKCNVEHLEPTEHMLKIKADASEQEVINAYKETNLLSKLGMGLPSPEVVKEAEKVAKKVLKAEEKKLEKVKEEPKEVKEKPKEEKPVEKKKIEKPKVKKEAKVEKTEKKKAKKK